MTTGTIATLPGAEPQAPEVEPMLAIHRGGDGVITFHKKTETGEFRNLFGIRARDLAAEFSRFQSELDSDSYWCINGFYSRDVRNKFPSAALTRQPENLRWLNAAFCDLDCHAAGLDFAETLVAVLKMQDAGEIPPASVIVRSGRGMWLLWVLDDTRHPDRPPGAFSEKLLKYCRVQNAIYERLASLGADANAKDAVHIMRVPGSVNTKPGAIGRVKFWFQAGKNCTGYRYTLDQLAQHFGVSGDLVSAEKKALCEAERPAGKRYRGFAQVNARRLREFSILRAMRSGFAEGCRNRAALLYGSFLRRSRTPREIVVAEVKTLAAECRPPLPPAETRQVIKSALSRKLTRFRDQTIADWLDVSEEEASYMEKLPPASRFGKKPDPAPDDARQRERHAAIKRIVTEQGTVPSCRAMVRLLRERQIETSHTQILRDFRALELRGGT
jgi:hypothetical protein